MSKWKTDRVVGFVVAKMTRLRLLLNYGPFPSLHFASLHFTSLLQRQGEQTWYTIIPQGLWDYLFTATLTEAEPLGSSSHGLTTWVTWRDARKWYCDCDVNSEAWKLEKYILKKKKKDSQLNHNITTNTSLLNKKMFSWSCKCSRRIRSQVSVSISFIITAKNTNGPMAEIPDLDHHQNQINCSLAHSRYIHQISWKFFHRL